MITVEYICRQKLLHAIRLDKKPSSSGVVVHEIVTILHLQGFFVSPRHVPTAEFVSYRWVACTPTTCTVKGVLSVNFNWTKLP